MNAGTDDLAPRRYVHTQAEPSDRWVTEHGLDTADVYVQLLDDDGEDLMLDTRYWTHADLAGPWWRRVLRRLARKPTTRPTPVMGPVTMVMSRSRVEVAWGAPVAGRAIVVA